MSTTGSPSSATPVGHQGARVDIAERPSVVVTGWLGVIVLLACAGGAVLAAQHSPKWLWAPILAFVLVATSLAIVPPGQTSVVQFFGRYIGTVRRPGFWWVLAPLTVRRGVSVRVRNFETGHLKVNDAAGVPVETRRHRRVAGGRHGQGGDVRRRQLQRLRLGPIRVGPAPRCDQPSQ